MPPLRRSMRRTARRTARRTTRRQNELYNNNESPANDERTEESSYADQLEELDELRTKGLITDEEFEAKKKQILDI